MTIKRRPYDFGIQPKLGYRAIFVTEIENYDEPLCSITVPETPDSFEYVLAHSDCTGVHRTSTSTASMNQ